MLKLCAIVLLAALAMPANAEEHSTVVGAKRIAPLGALTSGDGVGDYGFVGRVTNSDAPNGVEGSSFETVSRDPELEAYDAEKAALEADDANASPPKAIITDVAGD